MICLDTACFSKSFKPIEIKIQKKVSEEEKINAFKEDPRIDPSTGLSIPKWVALPDHSFITNYNYIKPCNSV